MKTKMFLILLLSVSRLYANINGLNVEKNVHCLACETPSGLSVSNLAGDSATLSWNAVASATQYTIEIEDEQNNPSTFQIETNVNGTSYKVSGLQMGVLYKFKVRARCGGDKSDWSEWVFFTAGNGGGNGGGSGNCDVPTGLMVNVLNGVATLSWNTINNASKYYLEVEDEQNNPSNFHLEDSSFTNTYILTGLQTGVLYKFKVRAHCANGQGEWSNWVFFNGNSGGNGTGSGNCSKPNGLQALNITASEALLTWNEVPGAMSYTLEIERNQNGTPFWQIVQVSQTNSFLLIGLDPKTKYKFKVRTNCGGGGHSVWTKWLKFSTASSFTQGGSANKNANEPVQKREADLGEFNPLLNLQIWPNPVQSLVNLRIQDLSTELATLRVLDLSGQIMLSQEIQTSVGIWEGSVDLSALPNGLYLAQIKSGKYSKAIKLIVNH